jgi:hypothetical protein
MASYLESLGVVDMILGLGPRTGEEETFRAEFFKFELETAQARIKQLTIENEALIANAFKTYKGNGNPNLARFGMAMHAITSERDGRAASDSLRKDYLERIAELEAELDAVLEDAAMIAVRKTHTAHLHNCDEDMALRALAEVAAEIRACRKELK